MNLVERVKAIMFRPRTEWPVIEQESDSLTGLFLNYVAILAAVPEVANFIGHSLIGGYAPIGSGLLRAIVAYLVTIVVVYVVAGVIDLLAPRFGGKKNFPGAVKLSVYSHTPLWLAGIFLAIPGLNFLLLLGGLYAFYLLWTGLPLLMGTNADNALSYAVIVAACALIPVFVLSMI